MAEQLFPQLFHPASCTLLQWHAAVPVGIQMQWWRSRILSSLYGSLETLNGFQRVLLLSIWVIKWPPSLNYAGISWRNSQASGCQQFCSSDHHVKGVIIYPYLGFVHCYTTPHSILTNIKIEHGLRLEELKAVTQASSKYCYSLFTKGENEAQVG